MQVLKPYEEAIVILREKLNKLNKEEISFFKHSEIAILIAESTNVWRLIGIVIEADLIELFKEVTGDDLLITPF